MKKCLVLGGNGFIGSSVSDALLREGHFLRILSRNPVPYRTFDKSEMVEWYVGDFLNINNIEELVEDIEVIIHLISTTYPQKSNENPMLDVESNFFSTVRFLEAIRKTPTIKKIIFFSSGGAVYGEPEFLPINEKHPTNPKNIYGVTKLAIEKYLQVFAEEKSIMLHILRVANPYGHRHNPQKNHGIIGVTLTSIQNNIPIRIFGNGQYIRDYIHVEDVANACALLLNYEGNTTVFNVGSGKGVTINSLLDNIEALLKTRIHRIYHPPRSFDIKANVLDVERLQQEIGWEPKILLETGLQELIKMY